jgi:DNA-binding beta-propeller fold protein YncE
MMTAAKLGRAWEHRNAAGEKEFAESSKVGETVGTKWRKISKSMLVVAAAACLWGNACSKTATNQVVVTLSPGSGTLLVTQSVTFTAIVTGATDVSSTFDCKFTTTPDPTTAVPSPKPSTPAECTSDTGVLSNTVNTSTTVDSTTTFTAPKIFPDPKKFPNLLITITATSKANTKKTGTSTINIDSGIRIHVIPATATMGTSSTQQFIAENFNNIVIPNSQVTWAVTYEVTAKIASANCAALTTNSCGAIDANGIYTAPATVPVAAPASTTTPVNAAGIVTVYAFSNVDNARIAQAAVTVVKAGNITFTGISPSVAPQGGLQQDIFLAATNATSQTGVTLINTADNSKITIDSSTQLKVVFAAGTAASSIGARVRLTSEQLSRAGHFLVQVSSSNTTVTVTGGPFPLDIVPVRPTLIGAIPDNFQEATLGQTGGVPFIIDGGFFGPPAAPTIAASVNGQALLLNNNPASTQLPSARRLNSFLPALNGAIHNAGLYPVAVQYTTSPGPFSRPTSTAAYTNIAVIPDYGGANSATPLSTVALPASSAPSDIAVDPLLGFAVVTLAGLNTPNSSTNTQNNIQFLNLASGTPSLGAAVPSGGNVATGVAIDDQLHVAGVVNYGSRSLSVHSIPAGGLLGTVDLSCVIPQSDAKCLAVTEPFPYSVGIDPLSHRAIVAFATTNVGLIINLDPNPPASLRCIPSSTPNITWALPYCPIAYVTLATGTNPQVAFEGGAHLAYVSPGGLGLLSAVDLANPSKGSVGIASATRASNVVTVTTTDPHNLAPGNPGTVLISNLPQGSTKKTNFNGSFAVGNVLDATHFQFSQADLDDTSTCPTPPPPPPPAPVPPASCIASSGVPFLTYTISPSTTGIAVNPVTRLAVLADPNVTFAQISFLDPQSETVNSMSLFAGATGQVSTGSPELGATNVAFQPFTNTAVSFNALRNEVSLLDPTALQRLQIIPTGQTGDATVCAANCTAATPTNVSLAGAVAVDGIHNLALVANSGSSNITVIKLGTIKAVHIERVLTPAIDPSSFAVPAQLAQAVKITSGVAPTPVSPVKIFGTGFTGASQVRLDGVALPSGVTFVSNQELDVTIPVSIPDAAAPGGTLGILDGPHHFALDVVTAGVASNVTDFTVVEEIPIPACSGTTVPTAAAPGGVAIDELHNLALVTNTACNVVSAISLDPARNFGTILKPIPTGGAPTAIAVLPRLAITGQPAGTSGVAVVTNNSANTVSILDLVNLTQVAGVTDVTVGTGPSGVAINSETNLAVIANSGSNTVSTLDLTPLTASPIGTLTTATVAVDQNPIAVAIDPDRGTSGRGLAVVTCLQLNGAAAPFGALDGVDIGGTTPVRLTAASISGLQSTPTGIVFDPSVSPALFYAVSTQGNQITSFNPDTNQAFSIKVGINPTAVAYNFQTGTMLTVNALSNSISIVDPQVFKTKATLGIGGTSRFSAAIHTFTNLAVIADQANNRVLLFPLPK